MSVSPSEIFGVADTLCKTATEKDCEASRRSSASRAYYAAMHATLLVIPDDLAPAEADFRVKDSHTVLNDAVFKWANQARPGRTEARILARKLPKLKYVRKCADYQIWDNFTATQASDALRAAAEIMRTADEAKRKLRLPAA